MPAPLRTMFIRVHIRTRINIWPQTQVLVIVLLSVRFSSCLQSVVEANRFLPPDTRLRPLAILSRLDTLLLRLMLMFRSTTRGLRRVHHHVQCSAVFGFPILLHPLSFGNTRRGNNILHKSNIRKPRVQNRDQKVP